MQAATHLLKRAPQFATRFGNAGQRDALAEEILIDQGGSKRPETLEIQAFSQALVQSALP
jgi:hypothetical protein